jgi:hypothetical protein
VGGTSSPETVIRTGSGALFEKPSFTTRSKPIVVFAEGAVNDAVAPEKTPDPPVTSGPSVWVHR